MPGSYDSIWHGRNNSIYKNYNGNFLITQGIDIPDIELVIVYGVPDTMSQLYQVLHIISV